MPNVRVLPMTADHIDAGRRLWSEAEGVEVAEGDAPPDVARYLARNPGISSVALDPTGEVVGAVLCGHDGRRGFVYHLAVARAVRGQGVGRAIMARSLGELRREGIQRALLLVAADNPGGYQFWLKDGWEDMTFAKPMGIDL